MANGSSRCGSTERGQSGHSRLPSTAIHRDPPFINQSVMAAPPTSRYHALEEMGVHPDSERKFMLQKINELREELRKNASHIWEWRAAHRRCGGARRSFSTVVQGLPLT